MFPRGYFPATYFSASYFAGGPAASTEIETEVRSGASFPTNKRRVRKWSDPVVPEGIKPPEPAPVMASRRPAPDQHVGPTEEEIILSVITKLLH